MSPLFDGASGWQERLRSSVSGSLLKPPKPKSEADVAYDPQQIVPVAERKEAMAGLDPVELKWVKGGLILATLLGGLLTLYLASNKATRTEKVNGHNVKVPLSGSWLLLGAVILLFCALGFLALRRRRRTLVTFSFFINGFAFALIFPPLGIALIALGGWLMLRAYRMQKWGTVSAKAVAREAAARPSRRQRRTEATAPPKPTGYKAPKANKRYTPKAPTRKKIAKPVE
jgi:hypothetical protein